MIRAIILTFLLIASINTMKTFKIFLTEQNQMQCDINGICKIVKTYESGGNEEKILGVYKDVKGLPTIGHGHLITPESEKVFKEVFAQEHEQDPTFGKTVLSGKSRLTPEQADRLLQRDVKVRIPKVQKMLPKFGSYSSELQGELASEHFRGMLGKSPTTIKLINAGDFEKAASEFLNAKDYRESVAKKTGIAKRMENLATALKKEGARQQAQRSDQQTTVVDQSSSTLQNAPSR